MVEVGDAVCSGDRGVFKEHSKPACQILMAD